MEFVVREIIMITVKGFKFEKEWINYYNDIVKYYYIFIIFVFLCIKCVQYIDNYLVYYFFIKILFCIKNGFLKI